MVWDPNLEKKKHLNHMLLFKHESPVDFSVITHMLKVHNIFTFFFFWTKVRDKIYPSSRDMKLTEVHNVKNLLILSG